MKIYLTAALSLFGWSTFAKFAFIKLFKQDTLSAFFNLIFEYLHVAKFVQKENLPFIVIIPRTLKSTQIPDIDFSVLQVRSPVFITIVKTI